MAGHGSRRYEASSRQASHNSVKGIDWSEHEAILQSLFHSDNDAFPVGGAEYDELREFIPKLARFRSQAAVGAGETRDPDTGIEHPQDQQLAEQLELPLKYDARYRLNVAVLTQHERRTARMGNKCPLSAVDLAEYRQMLALYEDFVQKRSMAKLVKLRREQQSLPIAAFRDKIVAAIEANPVVVIAGDTGCGKSTQVPQILLKAGYRQVACTQPRRISAISLCRRVAFETLQEHGSQVAYRIRFDSTRTVHTRILFLTEGILLRELLRDPVLSDYSVVIIDEVHERHVTTDLLLGLLRQVVQRRPELRLVLMSATINVDTYSAYFGGAPIVQVPGRLYPIRIEYFPQDEEAAARHKGDEAAAARRPEKPGQRKQERLNPAPYLRLLERIDQQVPAEERGDMLVFLSGMQEIATLADALRPYAAHTKRWIVLLLHSALSVEEQDRVFDVPPPGVRKVILSTNIAETSVTIDGVRFVVDSGRAKEMLHDFQSGGGSLQEGWISKASAEQRAGRAGRTGPGFCYRLYSMAQYSEMMAYPAPEIQRVALESVVLQIKALGGGDPGEFGFLDPPPEEALAKALTNLRQHEALEPRPRSQEDGLTPLGKVLAALPVEVHIGKMLVLGSLFHLAGPVVTMAAGLSVQSPFVRLPDTEEGDAIRLARKQFHSPHGDPFALVSIFDAWIKIKGGRHTGSRHSSRSWCRRHGLEEQRLYEMAKLQRQFHDLLRDSGLRAAASRTEEEERREKDDGGMEGEEARGAWRGPSRQRILSGSRRDRQDARARLRDLQRARDRDRGRKILHLDGEGEETQDPSDDEEEDEGEGRQSVGLGGRKRQRRDRGEMEGEEDYRSLELELAVDVHGMAVAAANRTLSRNDINVLKVIICSGLYPQFAVPDKHNMMRRESEHLYHTRHTRDARLHPGSVLASVENAVRMEELLAYGSLLETTKLYISSLVRVPALPALVLTAQSLDCSADARRLLVDDWHLIRVAESEEMAQHFLMVACELRAQVAALLRHRLKVARHAFLQAENATVAVPAGKQREGLPAFALHILERCSQPLLPASEEELARGLAELLDTSVRFSCETLAPEAAAALFGHSTVTSSQATGPGAEEGAPARHVVKGGVQLTPHLRYGSLGEAQPEAAARSYLRKHWTCVMCGAHLIATLLEIEEHLDTCGTPAHQSGTGATAPSAVGQRGRNVLGPEKPGVQGPDTRAGGPGGEEGWAEKEQGVVGLGRENVSAQIPEAGRSMGGKEADESQGVNERHMVPDKELRIFLAASPLVGDEAGQGEARDEGLEERAGVRMEEGAGEGEVEPGEGQKRDREEGHEGRGRQRYTCGECDGRVYLFTAPQILQHRRMHRQKDGTRT